MKKIYLALMLCILSVDAIVYEDAEDGSIARWTITDNTPVGAEVKNIVDATLTSKVIELKGASYDNEYSIGGDAGSNTAWNETEKRYLSFSINSQDGFFLDVILETSTGLRYLRYSDDNVNSGIDGEHIYIGLGYDVAKGE